MYIYVCLWNINTHTHTDKRTKSRATCWTPGSAGIAIFGRQRPGSHSNLRNFLGNIWWSIGVFDFFLFSFIFFLHELIHDLLKLCICSSFHGHFFWSIPLGIDNLPFLFTKACPYVCWFNPHHSWRPPNFASNCGYFRHFKALKVAVLRYNSTLGWF